MGTAISELKQRLARHLEKSGAVDANIAVAYPSGKREYPLRRAAVAVGIEEMESASGGLGGFWGSRRENGDLLHGSEVVITLRFDLYAATRENEEGDVLHRLFEGLCEALMLRENPFGIRKIWCGGTNYDKQEAAFHMAAFASLHTALLHSEASLDLEDFQLRLAGNPAESGRKE